VTDASSQAPALLALQTLHRSADAMTPIGVAAALGRGTHSSALWSLAALRFQRVVLLVLQVWNLLIIFVDAFYTALWLPVLATFEYKHSVTDSAGALNFAVGIILIVDIVLRFHAPIRLTSGYNSLMLNQPKAIGAPTIAATWKLSMRTASSLVLRSPRASLLSLPLCVTGSVTVVAGFARYAKPR
jgi:hypothetical protein